MKILTFVLFAIILPTTLVGVTLTKTNFGEHDNVKRDKDHSFIKKSDVIFTQPRPEEMNKPNLGKYNDYLVDKTMWGFLPSTYPEFDMGNGFVETMDTYKNHLREHKVAKIDWVSRIEWDVIWNGMLAKYPHSYHKAMVKRLDGSPLEIDWFKGHFFFSNHEPLFREYIKWQLTEVAFNGDETGPDSVSALLFDSQHTTPSQYYWGGDFSDGCMINFKQWLADNYSLKSPPQ